MRAAVRIRQRERSLTCHRTPRRRTDVSVFRPVPAARNPALTWHKRQGRFRAIKNQRGLIRWFFDEKRLAAMVRKLERASGIEPPSDPWQGPVLPLNHARNAWKQPGHHIKNGPQLHASAAD